MCLTVAYDATAAVRQSAGIGRYARELLRAMASTPGDHELRVVYCNGGEHDGNLPALPSSVRTRAIPFSDRIMNAVWQRARIPLPVQLFAGRFDLFHSPDFTLPPVLGRPTVLTIHDLAFLTTPDAAYPTLRAYLARVVPASVRRATRVIAVSESTRRDLVTLLGVPPERITTIAEGVSSVFSPPVDSAAARARVSTLGLDEPFILSVGTIEPRKNYLRLLEAYAALPGPDSKPRLVIAGKPGWLYEPVFRRITDLGLEERVTFLQPSDTELADLYGCCEVFVYPSLYEGFGIPPLEAMACGAPVACSSSSCLPELVGDDALLFDPTSVDEILSALETALTDERTRHRLRTAGPARAAHYSWQRAAEQTLAVYHEVARGA